MSQLYIHHVAKLGESDLLKTVFTRISFDFVEKHLDKTSIRNHILDEIKVQFPNGLMNIWGVPEGAPIKLLQEGDFILLLGAVQAIDSEPRLYEGQIVALAEIKFFRPIELPDLSQALWGKSKFPYVFFFETEPLSLSWSNFGSYIYQNGYTPLGLFQRVTEEKLSRIGGVLSLIEVLRTVYVQLNGSAEIAKEIDLTSLAEEVISLNQAKLGSSSVIDEDRPLIDVKRPIRHAAFALTVRRNYKNRCAICGSELYGPKHNAEVEAAHIIPVKLKGTDNPTNGIALCNIHHWAFDNGWLSIANNYLIIVREDIPLKPDYEIIYRYKGKLLQVPYDLTAAPNVHCLQIHRRLHGFEK